jgi:solute carrier family 8 (sodium/calcium exchanger)
MKSKVDSILLKANSIGICDCGLWGQQFKNLADFQYLGGFSPLYSIFHVLALPWKLMAAFIPPASTLGGIAPFIMSSGSILFIVPFICDIAGHLGCFIYCTDCLTGFLLVALPMNLPNLLAAKIAAAEEETADLPLINLLAGNCFTTSLGFSLPWLIAAVYWEAQGLVFEVEPGSLGFCVVIFFNFAMLAFILLFGRRCCAGGELGGNQVVKFLTTSVFFLLWALLVLLTSLEAYGVLKLDFII